MGIEATVIVDSISESGKRLTTMVWRYPRFIHSEVMTHRVFSRNAASSRAIPIQKMLEQVRNDPALPIFWGKNQPGMKSAEELVGSERERTEYSWLQARDEAIGWAECLSDIGLHKQIANRILEPWMWMTTIVTATEWANFYYLRRHPDAQPELKALADAAYAAHTASKPTLLTEGQWHLPFLTNADYEWAYDKLKLSVARCARVSYLNHDKTAPEPGKDIALHDRLLASGHMSPFEHQATPVKGFRANFNGWKQYRATFPNENITSYPGI